MVLARSLRPGLDATAPRPGLATTAAEHLLGRAALGMLLIDQFGDDACDSFACFAERALGRGGGVCHADGEFVQSALNAAGITQ